ncbi:MAG: ATP-dependent helicase [Candidatus Auribacter fodinae]|jgi:DNA helicase-2/ATP-dependent DNA helicase PcrA|uniref:DNA 3'-5' helicase II n=1 Tax=Candidatus Auribacter fodinae TaxID=2093366 RepID=A0A3A4R7J8_9BACT|nr:MAG: ATP-dependent helicase [Candidatus Auribacter fodinae]
MTNVQLNPAEQAAQKALERMYACIDNNKSFIFEAGAGAGKTYSLVKALKYLIEKKGKAFLRQNQQIACISYTNVASNEIASRIDNNKAIYSSTIHSFCWMLMKGFQASLKKELGNIDNFWSQQIQELGSIDNRTIGYDELGRRSIDDKHISISHNDVLSFFVKLMGYQKFRIFLISQFPILFIDEYQDTDKLILPILKTYFLDKKEGILLGFFGDHWQKIYGTGCGKIEHSSLEVIGKESNFRSVSAIVHVLNRIRPELPQYVKDEKAQGSVTIYHTNNWKGTRRTGQHWAGDLPADIAHNYLEALKRKLESSGWNFLPEKTKILMLTHNVLATEQGYNNLADVFQYNDIFIKKEDPHIAFFVDKLEPFCIAYENKRYGEMFSIMGQRVSPIVSHSDKESWKKDMSKLIALRSNATIGDVLNHLKITNRPNLPESVKTREDRLEELEDNQNDEVPSYIDRITKLKKVTYREVTVLTRFIEGFTPFSTKHGVKGAEFENVLVVMGRGWNQYNFNQFLEWAGNPNSIPSDKQETFERNRNLFYVVCSRPIKRLAILFTQELSSAAITTLSNWFGRENIHAL